MALFNKKLGLIREGKLSENNEDEQFLKDVKTVFQIVGKSFYTVSFFKYFKTPMYRQYEDAMTNVMRYVLTVLIYCWEVNKRQSTKNNTRCALYFKVYYLGSFIKRSLELRIGGT